VTIQLVIVSPEGIVFEGPAASVVLPGTEGEFGVLPEHARFLAPLKIGELTIAREGGERVYAAISGGFANVDGSSLIVLADTCELASSIDLARAKRAKERAEQELARLTQKQAEQSMFVAQEAALHRALIRIQVAGQAH